MTAMLPPLILELRASAGKVTSTLGGVSKQLDELDKKSDGSSGRMQKGFNALAGVGKAALLGIGSAAVVVGAASVKLATDFQTATTTLVTGAGESEKNIDMVRKGILAMAGTVASTPKQLADGMYLIESAGYHGAQGLAVLKAAAEGAKVGNADMTVVANGLTTALTDYNIPAARANQVTSALVQTVADGKTTMQDLANSLGMVMPKAAAMGVSFQQVTGALATMTGAGYSARRASMTVAAAIMALGAPSHIAVTAMKAVGLSAQQVKDSLGKNGLSGTLQMIEDHVGKTFPKGSVASVTALKNIVGGTQGYGAALALTGTHMKTFQSNIADIGGALTGQNKTVQGFNLTQKDMQFKFDAAKASLQAMGIKLGDFLIPKITQAVGIIMKVVGWLQKHKDVAIAIAVVVGGVLTAAFAAWAISLFTAGGALAFLMSPITLIVAAIAGLVFGVIYAWKHFTLFRDIVKQVWHDVQVVVMAVWNGFLKPAFNAIVAIVKFMAGVFVTQFNITKTVVMGLWNDAIKPVFNFVRALFADVIVPVVQEMAKVFARQFQLIKDVVLAVWNDAIKPIFGFIVNVAIAQVKASIVVLRDVWGAVWGTIKTVLSTAWTVVKAIFGFFQTVAINPLRDAIGMFGAAWSAVWDGVKTVIQDVWNFIKPIIDTIKNAVGGVVGVIGKVAGGIGKGIHAVTHFLGFDVGGAVPGPVGAPLAAIVHGGEYVVSHDMLTGRSPVDASVAMAILSSLGSQRAVMSTIAGAARTSVGSPSGLASGGYGTAPVSGHGGGGVEIKYVFHIDGIIDYDGLFRAMQKAALQHGGRNSKTWAPFARAS